MAPEKKSVELAEFDPDTNQLLDLWFYDSPEIAHGCGLRIKVKEVLCHYRSSFQEIAVFETEKLGRMLVLDNITMLTEFDEFAYHEMIAHPALLVHPQPARILVIGGGDGGTVREIIKHPEVEEIHVCELDEQVIKACQRFLPSLASSFDDHRVKIFFEDGAQFVSRNPEAYDVIIVDSTDPVGPGKILFQRPFYSDLRKALRKNGIAVNQCESIYFHGDVIRNVASFAAEIYPRLGYYNTMVPTYPGGTIGFMFCSLRYDPLNDLSPPRAAKLKGLRYYNPAIHRAAFELPNFAALLLDQT